PDGHAWVLAVEDDGSGLPAQPKPGARRGLGLDAMRARAAEMDAALRLAAVPTGGTRVELRFRPGAQRGI
ncbi:MAG TPA: ATP-binding protein, partial [Candidatus Polarisedimenticolaceae bacterium]|nr:ATP-binding protein [Candidatus Polarisedimenticolaceae bacterium]